MDLEMSDYESFPNLNNIMNLKGNDGHERYLDFYQEKNTHQLIK